MASGDQRPVHQQSPPGTPEERSDRYDGSERSVHEVEGFRFECQPGCSACCEVEGEVYLTEQDLARISGHLAMDPGDFEAKYVHRTARSLRLRKPPEGQCIFHGNKRCSIHAVKPVQCRVFPFWPEVIETAGTWNETAERCPGMNRGPLVQIEKAREIAAEMRAAYPQMYPKS